LIVAVVALGAAASAFADANQHFDAKVRVLANSDKFEYHGRIRSDLPECEVDRKVLIKRGPSKIGNAVTDLNGRFSRKAASVPDGSTVTFKLADAGVNCPGLRVEVEIKAHSGS
jgi:hypothetical protein